MRLPVLPTVYVASPGRGSAPHTDVRWLIKILASASLFESLFAFAFVGLNKSSMFTAESWHGTRTVGDGELVNLFF